MPTDTRSIPGYSQPHSNAADHQPPGDDAAATKPRHTDWRAKLATIQLVTKAVVDAGLRQHGEPPYRVASAVIAAVAEGILERLEAHPDGDFSKDGIHAVVTAAVETAGQFDTDNEGLAVMAALD